MCDQGVCLSVVVVVVCVEGAHLAMHSVKKPGCEWTGSTNDTSQSPISEARQQDPGAGPGRMCAMAADRSLPSLR